MNKSTAYSGMFLSILLILLLSMTACNHSAVEEEVTQQPEIIAPIETAPEPKPAPEPTPEPESIVIPGGPYAGGFALSNESGTKLIMYRLGTSTYVDNDPTLLDVAIGDGSSLFQVRYSGYQEGIEGSARPNSNSFDYMRGHVYELVNSSIKPNTPYFITESKVFAQAIIPIAARPWPVNYEEQVPPARDSAIKQRENEKGLNVIYSETLATVGTDGYLELFQYEQAEDVLHFEIIYDDGVRTISVDFPDNTGMRDSSGISPSTWIPLFFCDIEGTLVMATLWTALEGGSISVWFEDNGTWTRDEVLQAYWYLFPL